MKRISFGVGLCLLSAASCAPAHAESSKPNLNCVTGPVTKTYGGTPWLVYSCNDRRSIVIVSAPGSTAQPFYFLFYPEGSGFTLEGEGTGSKDITDAAYEELRKLSASDVAKIVEETEGR